LSLHQHSTICGLNLTSATTAEPLDVAVLTRGMAAGDEAAYRVFYDAYFHRLFRYLLVVAAGNEDAAGEALQSTLVRVVRHIRVFPNDTVFWSWLTVLARSAFSDQTRKGRRYLAFLDRFLWQGRGQEPAPEDPDPDTRLLVQLKASLETLDDHERRIIEGKYIAGRSVRDIAAELALSEKAVEGRLTRIRQKLKMAILAGLKHD
jgi:RNA polymerase sigma-70 factor, ECF subfamily